MTFGMLPLHKPLSVSTIIRLLTESTSNPNFALDKAESTPTTGPTSSPGYASTTSYGPITTAHPSGNTGGGGGAHTSTSTNVGAIVGGVVGGVIGLALVALLAIFLFRHRNSDRAAPSYFANTSQYSNPNPFVDGSMMETSFPGSPTRLSVRSTFCSWRQQGSLALVPLESVASCHIPCTDGRGDNQWTLRSLTNATVLLRPDIRQAGIKYEVVVNLCRRNLNLDRAVCSITYFRYESF